MPEYQFHHSCQLSTDEMNRWRGDALQSTPDEVSQRRRELEVLGDATVTHLGNSAQERPIQSITIASSNVNLFV